MSDLADPMLEQSDVLLVDFPMSKMERLREKARAFRSFADVKDRKYRLRTHKKCFIACHVIDALVNNGTVLTRAAAVDLGKTLAQELNLFEHVCDDHEFADEYLFFRFAEDKDDSYMKTSTEINLLKKAQKAVTKVANKTVSSIRDSMILDQSLISNTHAFKADFIESSLDPSETATEVTCTTSASEPDLLQCNAFGGLGSMDSSMPSYALSPRGQSPRVPDSARGRRKSSRPSAALSRSTNAASNIRESIKAKTKKTRLRRSTSLPVASSSQAMPTISPSPKSSKPRRPRANGSRSPKRDKKSKDNNKKVPVVLEGQVSMEKDKPQVASKECEDKGNEGGRSSNPEETDPVPKPPKPVSPPAWDCTGCEEKDIVGSFAFCGMCGTLKPEDPRASWECHCGFPHNENQYPFCGGCGKKRDSLDPICSRAGDPLKVLPIAA